MIFHCCQSVVGPLMYWKKADWKRACLWFTKDDGSRYTADGLKQAFLDELAQGHKVIPLSAACDNFDYTKGCLGHPDGWKRMGETETTAIEGSRPQSSGEDAHLRETEERSTLKGDCHG